MLEYELDKKRNLQKFLFDKGFLLTNKKISKLTHYPFYSNWNENQLGDYYLYNHKDLNVYFVKKNNLIFFLLGHAFNPFTMETDEKIILENISKLYKTKKYQNYVNELTGIFLLGVIDKNDIELQNDCSGMQFCAYAKINGILYISSHSTLIGDLCDLPCSDYANRLINYRWYKFMLGNYLPFNLTRYDEVKRIIPNTILNIKNGKFQIKRFYPNKKIKICEKEKEYKKCIASACEIMQNTMNLISKKWKKPAISLTGGIDSNTTFAAANNFYDKYLTFSYVCMEREKTDAKAAKIIANRFNVKHTIYKVPDSNDEIKDFDLYKKIFIHNDGEMGTAKDDDTRKKITLIKKDVCDVEVKSWISETIRAYGYKYFGQKKMPKKLKPRLFTSLYKIFLFNRKLAVETDGYFAQYIKETKLKNKLFNYDASDIFVWEMMHGGKCSLNIGVMKSCFDITIPYNNRKLLDLLLSVPLNKRISDEHHLDMKKQMNKVLYDMNIRIVNGNDTKIRKLFLKIYFKINNLLPY